MVCPPSARSAGFDLVLWDHRTASSVEVWERQHIRFSTKKITRHTKRQEKKSEDTKKAPEPDSDIIQMLELSDKELK